MPPKPKPINIKMDAPPSSNPTRQPLVSNDELNLRDQLCHNVIIRVDYKSKSLNSFQEVSMFRLTQDEEVDKRIITITLEWPTCMQNEEAVLTTFLVSTMLLEKFHACYLYPHLPPLHHPIRPWCIQYRSISTSFVSIIGLWLPCTYHKLKLSQMLWAIYNLAIRPTGILCKNWGSRVLVSTSVIFNAKVVISGSDTNEQHAMVLGTLPLIQFGAGYSPPQKTKNVQHLSSQILQSTEMWGVEWLDTNGNHTVDAGNSVDTCPTQTLNIMIR
jgi:hypothetical protein